MAAHLPSASVVVATYMRPEYVRECLEHLTRQTVAPAEFVVVDASPDERTRHVIREFPGVRYLRNERGAGSLATSRAIGVAGTKSEIIAFIDDDAFAEPAWLEQLLLRYRDEKVAAVGGRALNGVAGEESEGIGQIGRLLPNGRLTGYFAADPGKDVEVDHMLGANMSVRRSVVERLGGIHDYYPGMCLREDTDMPLRMRRAGYRVIYTPTAVVQHVAAPYERGRRFDLRYSYYAQRNHLVLLSRTVGVTSGYFRRYLRSTLLEIAGDLGRSGRSLATGRGARARVRGMGGGLSRALFKLAGLCSGAVRVTVLRVTEGPVLPSPTAISESLSEA